MLQRITTFAGISIEKLTRRQKKKPTRYGVGRGSMTFDQMATGALMPGCGS